MAAASQSSSSSSVLSAQTFPNGDKVREGGVETKVSRHTQGEKKTLPVIDKGKRSPASPPGLRIG